MGQLDEEEFQLLAKERISEPGVNFLLDFRICPLCREGAGGMKARYDVKGDVTTVTIAWDRVPMLKVGVVIE